MNIFYFILNIYFAVTLGASGLSKLNNPLAFISTLREQKILPSWSINFIRHGSKKACRQLHRLVLTLLLETHASYRQIQTCLQSLHGISLSVSSMCRIVAQAGERARHWLSLQRPSSPRALAREEQSSSKRGEVYLNVVDVHSGQVWASLPSSRSSGRRELDDCVVGLARTGSAR